MTATRPYPATPSAATLARRQPPSPGRPHAPGSENPDRRQLLDQASHLHDQARLHAEAGDIATAAQTILRALSLERRAGGLGPQVLQLIKPR